MKNGQIFCLTDLGEAQLDCEGLSLEMVELLGMLRERGPIMKLDGEYVVIRERFILDPGHGDQVLDIATMKTYRSQALVNVIRESM